MGHDYQGWYDKYKKENEPELEPNLVYENGCMLIFIIPIAAILSILIAI